MKNLVLHNEGFKVILVDVTQWLGILGYSPKVVKNVPIYLQEFFHYLEDYYVEGIDEVTAENVKNYYKYLKKRPKLSGGKRNHKVGGGLSKISLNHHISALRLLKSYLYKHGVHSFPMPLTYEERDSISASDILTQSEIKMMFEACNHSSRWEHVCLRDKAMLVVLYSCGLRRNEAFHLNRNDLLISQSAIHVRKGKNYKERLVPMNDYNLDVLENYIYGGRSHFCLEQDNEALFLGRDGKRLGGQSFKLRLRKIIATTGDPRLMSKRITPHRLRHSIGTHLLQQGVQIEIISRFLGHSTLESTQVYTHILKELNDDTEIQKVPEEAGIR